MVPVLQNRKDKILCVSVMNRLLKSGAALVSFSLDESLCSPIQHNVCWMSFNQFLFNGLMFLAHHLLHVKSEQNNKVPQPKMIA